MASPDRPDQTKEEQVAHYLREGIIAGRFSRGARLKQQEIADRLKTSITPVREALKLLAAEGYVSGDSFRGSVVAPFDLEASREAVDLRIVLESQLARGAVERASRADFADLCTLADEFRQAFESGQNETARAANYRFHHRMFEIAGMPQTLHFVQILWARYPFDLINRLQGRVSRAADEHDEMLRAFVAKDVAGLLLATRDHVESGWAELKQVASAENDLQASEKPVEKTMEKVNT